MAVTAAEMVIAIKEALKDRAESGGTGVTSVTIDGTSTKYSIDEAYRELKFWQKLALDEAGTRRTVCSIDLRGA